MTPCCRSSLQAFVVDCIKMTVQQNIQPSLQRLAVTAQQVGALHVLQAVYALHFDRCRSECPGLPRVTCMHMLGTAD